MARAGGFGPLRPLSEELALAVQGRAVAVEGFAVVAGRRGGGAPFSIRSDEQCRPLALVGEEVRARAARRYHRSCATTAAIARP